MSDEILKENEQLKLNQKGLIAQLDAAKQMVNEGLQTALQLRTNMNILGQTHQELIRECANIKSELQAIKAEKDTLLARVTELDAQVTALYSQIAPQSGENANASEQVSQ